MRLLPAILALSGIAMVAAGCRPSTPTKGGLVLTQLPPQPLGRHMAMDALDLRYPPGSRVVWVDAAAPANPARVLSAGLLSAGAPAVSYDGQSVLFCAKANDQASWQIYKAEITGDQPRPLTSLEGGAMDPAFLPDGRFVFSAPVPRFDRPAGAQPAPAIYAQALAGGPAERLSHTPAAATDLTVLRDGRILFVAGVAGSSLSQGLFTINNDGTEITAFAGVHDGPARLARPRESASGRVVFLRTAEDARQSEAQNVLTSRPFSSRQPVLPGSNLACRSLEPDAGDSFLAALQLVQESTFGIYRLGIADRSPGQPLFDDPQWHDVEAVVPSPRTPPMGRISTLETNRTTGHVLCLNVNRSSYAPAGGTNSTAVRVRFTKPGPDGTPVRFGETRVEKDGSFLVELPADEPFGLETLDAQGKVLRTLPPVVWVRPGENRACIGCHEPHNTAPDNIRPLAVKRPAVRIVSRGLASAGSQP